jgi:hypothetical protein
MFEVTKFGIETARNSEFKKRDFFEINSCELGKRFLSQFIDLSSNLSVTELQAEYFEKFDDKVSFDDFDDFFSHISNKWIIEKNPKNELLKWYRNATADLRDISKRIEIIDKSIEDINSLGKLQAEQRYYKKQLVFFKERNKIAYSEILSFLENDIDSYTIGKCKRDHSFFKAFLKIGSWFNQGPYRYARKNSSDFDEYDPEKVTVISNKFLDLPISLRKEVKKYHETDLKTFYEFALQYINGEILDIPPASDRISKTVSNSYILMPRKFLLERLMTMFYTQDYIAFVNIAPLQIEGIFTDICVALGVKDSELDISSINKKLDLIAPEMDDFYIPLYDYYSFKFPLLRNSVAHGEVYDGNYEHAAIMLMLDLLPVCKLTISQNVSANKKIKIIEDANRTKDFGKVIAWLEEDIKELPDFFNWREGNYSLLSYLTERSFWTEMLWRVVDSNDDEIEKLISLAKKIRNRKIENFSKKFIPDAGRFLQDRKNLHAKNPIDAIHFHAEKLAKIAKLT